jgi:hypothetical protein
MLPSRIALAVLLLATTVSGVAVAAPSSAPTPCDTCGAPFNDVDRGPFARRDYITSVEPYRVTETSLKHSWIALEGAVINVRPAPGVTREWLQRAVEDHLGRMAASGPMGNCPLSVAGASASVSSTQDGFAITVQSKDKNAANEILRRAELLASR